MYRPKLLLFFLLCALIGATLGLVLAWAQLGGWLNHWSNLGTPPEQPIRIVAASSRGVWVEAASGQLYVGSPQGKWDVSTGNLPSQKVTGSEADVRRKPKPIEDAIGIWEAIEPVGTIDIYSVYAIREDGNVYLWQDWPKPEDRKNLIIAPTIGAFLFLFFPLFVVTLYKWAQERKPGGRVSEEVLTLRRDYW